MDHIVPRVVRSQTPLSNFTFQAVGASSPAFSLDFLRACPPGLAGPEGGPHPQPNWNGPKPSTRSHGSRRLPSVLKMSSAPRAQVSLGEGWGSQMLSHENSFEAQSILSFLTSG